MQLGSSLSWIHFHGSLTVGFQSSLSSSLSVEELFPTSCGRTIIYWRIPRKRCTVALSLGVSIFVIASTLAGSGSTPLSVSLCPMKVTEGDLNWKFFADSRRSCLLLFSNRLMRFLSWSISASSFELPHLKTCIPSAMFITPCKPSRNSYWRRWCSSGSRLSQKASWCSNSDRLALERGE